MTNVSIGEHRVWINRQEMIYISISLSVCIAKPQFPVIQYESVQKWPMEDCKVKSKVTKTYIKFSHGSIFL